jgi:hypothetical protein
LKNAAYFIMKIDDDLNKELETDAKELAVQEEDDDIIEFSEKLPGKINSPEQERNNRIINSSVAYMASLATVYISFFLITSLIAKQQKLFYKLFFFKVEFTQNYTLWEIPPVLKTFSAGPIFCVVMGTIALIVQKFYRKRPGILKLFWLWLGINYLNFFCAQMILMPIKANSQGINASYLGIVADYMYFEDFGKMIFSVIAAILLVFIGSIVAKPFIQLTNSTQNIHKNENKLIYLFQTVFLPWLICSAVSLIYFSDGSFILNLALVLTMFMIVISIFINAMKSRMIMIYKMPETGEIENKFLIVLSSVLIFMKIFLNNGIRF